MADGARDLWISVAMSEYASLRDESLRALQAQQVVVQIGVTLMTAITAAAFTIDGGMLRQLILTVFVPVILLMVIVVWRGEVERSVRAGAFLREREVEISEVVKINGHTPAMSWERWLGENPQFRLWLYYRAELAIVALLSFVAIGASRTEPTPNRGVDIALSLIGFCITVGSVAFFIFNERRLANKLRI